jgi:hypothetical protein
VLDVVYDPLTCKGQVSWVPRITPSQRDSTPRWVVDFQASSQVKPIDPADHQFPLRPGEGGVGLSEKSKPSLKGRSFRWTAAPLPSDRQTGAMMAETYPPRVKMSLFPNRSRLLWSLLRVVAGLRLVDQLESV